MNMRKWMARLLLAAVLPVFCVCGGLAEEAGELEGHIVILHTSDSHGHVDDHLGFARAAYAKKVLEEAGAVVLLVDAGDALHGLPIATVEEGEAIIEIMNQAGYNAMTLGDHDFNYGSARIQELAQTAKFPVLSANVVGEGGAEFLSGCAIFETGVAKLGIFGLTAAETADEDNTEGLLFRDPIAAAQEQVDALKEEGCTLIIALTHLGTEGEAEMVASQVDGIDVMIDGCSHTTSEEGHWTGDTLIVSAGEYIEYIGCVDIAPNGVVSASLLTEEDLGEDDVDAAVEALISSIRVEQNDLTGQIVGHTDATLDGTQELICTQETNLGDLAADAVRAAVGADIALIKGRCVCASIPAGEITRAQLIEVFPNGDYVTALYVTGQKVLDILEYGVSMYPEADGRFLQVSGLTFRFDPDQPAGSRVYDVQVNGAALEMEKTYLLAVNDCIANGDDGFPLSDVEIAGEFGSLEEALTDYVRSMESGKMIQTEGRIVAATQAAE